MKRLWIASALALGFHGVLLNSDLFNPIHNRQEDTLRKPVTLTLLNQTPEPPKILQVAQPQALEPARREPEKVPELLSEPQPVTQPKPRPKAKPEIKQRNDPLPLKAPESKPAPEQQEYSATADTGPKTSDIPATVTRSRDTETQPVKRNREAIAEVMIHEAIPLYDRNPPPRYPQQARKRGFQGTVILKVLVGKDGRVADIRMQESSGHSILDNIALETVRGWAFTPGRRGEDPVEMWIRVPMLFELK